MNKKEPERHYADFRIFTFYDTYDNIPSGLWGIILPKKIWLENDIPLGKWPEGKSPKEDWVVNHFGKMLPYENKPVEMRGQKNTANEQVIVSEETFLKKNNYFVGQFFGLIFDYDRKKPMDKMVIGYDGYIPVNTFPLNALPLLRYMRSLTLNETIGTKHPGNETTYNLGVLQNIVTGYYKNADLKQLAPLERNILTEMRKYEIPENLDFKESNAILRDVYSFPDGVSLPFTNQSKF